MCKINKNKNIFFKQNHKTSLKLHEHRAKRRERGLKRREKIFKL